MAVPALDSKAAWSSGKSYADWLAACKPQMRADIERFDAEVAIPAVIASKLTALKRRVHVLAIIEDWCGDVRRNAPVLAKLCALNPEMLRLRCVDKETRPELMVRYLTNAAEAIPIFVFYNHDFVEVGNWGPRPAECKRLIARGKAAGQIDAAREKIHAYYAADKHQSTIAEICALIDIAAAEEV
ncbi:MAG TPA: thioredoxin family protein [Planctomycetota bacterium]|nr:thioredoxin family protein [Planctomycetota bacterium]